MTLPEDRGYFNSPSVYRGKPASKREQWGNLLPNCRARAGSRPVSGLNTPKGGGSLFFHFQFSFVPSSTTYKSG